MNDMKYSQRNLLFSLTTIAIVLICPFYSIFCQESPPLMTDDSGVPGAGKWENNLGFAFEGNNKNNSLEGPILDINYGAGDHIQLKYEMGWMSQKDEHVANKFDAILLGVKYKFSDGTKDGLEYSLYPQALFSFNNENGKKIEYGFKIPAAISKEYPFLNFSIQGGVELLGSTTHLIYGLMAGREFGEIFGVMAEIHGTLGKANIIQNGEEHNYFFNEETFINVGINVKFSSHVTFLAAAGRKLSTPSTSEHGGEFFGYGGLQFLM